MEQYKVEITKEALQDMEDIYNYIALELLSPENAMGQYNRIADEILTLDTFPQRYRIMDSEPEKQMELPRKETAQENQSFSDGPRHHMPLQGLSQGTQPIISQNYGAGEINRANEASKKLIIFSLIFSFIFVLILNIFPQVFVRIFNQNETLISVARKLIRIMFIGMAFMGIQIGCQNSFLALGKSKISLILALLRKIILLIPLTFILPLFIQSKGIFIAESVADVLAILVTLICYLCLFKKYLKLPINTNKK